jgi:hypothetical protein
MFFHLALSPKLRLTKLRFHLPKNKLTKGFRMLTHEKNKEQMNEINTTPTTDLNTATSPISAHSPILDPLQDSISSLELVRVSGSDADVVNAARETSVTLERT